MRRLIAKEMRDLAPVGLVLAVAGFLGGWEIAHSFELTLPPLALLCAACGAAMGVTQGLLDRRRCEDPFLLHRPMSALRIHAVRGAVGAGIASVAAALVVVRALTRTSEGTLQIAAAGVPLPAPPVRIQPDLAGALACVAGAVVLHAVARLALTPRRPVAAAALLVVLPTMVFYALLSVETQSAPWLLFAAVAGAATALSSLQLAGRSA